MVSWNWLKMFPAIQTRLIPSRKQSELLEVGLEASQVPLDNGVLHCFSQASSSISSTDRAENWLERTRFCSAFFSLSEATGLGGTWGLLEGVERLGCENPSTSTRTPSTLTLVGEHLEDDESSFEAAVFKGPAVRRASVVHV